LAEASTTFSEARRLFGSQIGRKYIQRLMVLRAVGKFTEVFGLRALKLHPLKGKRTKEYSIALKGNYRLIIEKLSEEQIRIIDVEDYHGD
jgi:plasmid maintenance system killer protein